MKKPKITVVTVTYNCVSLVEKTIQSVLAQTYPDIEYIIIDGLSTDGTVDIIKKYEKQISSWVSEKDNGIFDAMNKGIRMATGEWLIFMNAGDSFTETITVQQVFSNNIADSIGFIFGDTFALMGEKKVYNKVQKPFPNNKRYFRPMGFNHQAAFTRTTLAKEYLFDLSFKIAADYNMINSIYESGYTYHYVNIPVATVDTWGFSSQNRRKQRMEVAIICGCQNDIRFKIWNNYKSIRSGVKKLIKRGRYPICI